MKTTHVFFDFAGTLVEGVPSWEWPQIVACAEAGITVTPGQVKSAIWQIWEPLEGCTHLVASRDEASYGVWIDEIEGRILDLLGVPRSDLPGAIRRVTDLQVSAAGYQVHDDVVPTLQALRERGIRLGIVSNFAWHLPRLVWELRLADLVDDIVTSARVGYRKPRPEIFQTALTRLGAHRGNSVFVGDDLVCDGVGSANAGIRGLLIDRTGNGVRGDSSINSLAEIPGRLGL